VTGFRRESAQRERRPFRAGQKRSH